MKFQFASDLHIEYKNNEIPFANDYIIPKADILILAGDIGSLYKLSQLKGFLAQLCVLFKFVLYIPGNHEYYRIEGQEPVSMNILNDRLYSLEKDLDNLFILNEAIVQIENVCIVGTTLWSKPLVKYIPTSLAQIKDFKIYDYQKLHFSNLNFITKKIEYCKNNNLKLLVVTHHCPTYDVVGKRKKNHKYVSLYASNLDYLLKKDKVHTWICGHVHRNFNYYTKEGTHLVGNQRGKPRDNIRDYRKDMIVDI